MNKAETWQVDALRLYLRSVMARQLGGLEEEKKAAFGRVIEKRSDAAESETLERILRIRERLAKSHQAIALEDYGAGAGKSPRQRTVGSIHRTSAVPHWWGVFLFRLVRELRPGRVVELGANLGVSAAYIQSALSLNGNEGRLITVEGDPTLAAIAQETLAAAGNSKGEVVLGRFQDVLQTVLERMKPVDLVFIDGHHEYGPTLDYFERIRPFLAEGSCVVFDDVYLWSRPVRRAWKEIVKKHPESHPIDLAKFGILVGR